MTFTTGDNKGSNYCYIGDLGLLSGLKKKTYLIGCIDEIIGFHRKLNDQETSYIHQYLMTNNGYNRITDEIACQHTKVFPKSNTF